MGQDLEGEAESSLYVPCAGRPRHYCTGGRAVKWSLKLPPVKAAGSRRWQVNIDRIYTEATRRMDEEGCTGQAGT